MIRIVTAKYITRKNEAPQGILFLFFFFSLDNHIIYKYSIYHLFVLWPSRKGVVYNITESNIFLFVSVISK